MDAQATTRYLGEFLRQLLGELCAGLPRLFDNPLGHGEKAQLMRLMGFQGVAHP
jgi:hypothetical protein